MTKDDLQELELEYLTAEKAILKGQEYVLPDGRKMRRPDLAIVISERKNIQARLSALSRENRVRRVIY